VAGVAGWARLDRGIRQGTAKGTYSEPMPLYPAAAKQQAINALAAAGLLGGLTVDSFGKGTDFVTTTVSGGNADRVLAVLRNLPGVANYGKTGPGEVWVNRRAF
jgi:hypothetical protein